MSDTITIDDVVYDVQRMTPHQRALLLHVRDLERQITQAEFSLTQLRVSHEAFVQSLARDVQHAPGV